MVKCPHLCRQLPIFVANACPIPRGRVRIFAGSVEPNFDFEGADEEDKGAQSDGENGQREHRIQFFVFDGLEENATGEFKWK